MCQNLVVLVCLSATISSTHGGPPNIVVILADDLGYNDVSWHNEAVISPHLDKLATEGIILEQHYSQPTCSPTRGALLTGKYPIHSGLHNGVISPLTPYGLDTTFTTLAEELHRADYATHIVGKWHLGFCNKKFWPTNRGFDSHYGLMTGETTYYTHTRDGGYDFFDDEVTALADNGTYSTTLIQDRAVEIIANHEESKPLFMYVPFQAVHMPVEVPEIYENMYSEIQSSKRRKFLGMVTAMDDAVGNITEALKSANLYDNTVIVFLSDNGGAVKGWLPFQDGGANNWPLRGAKITLFEGGTRTVSFVHSPKYLSPRISTNWMHVSDWFPTLLSIAGLSPTDNSLDGLNQWTQLQDASLPSPRTEMIYNIAYPNHPEWGLVGGPPMSAIRVGDWKYIHRTWGYAGWAEPPENEEIHMQFRKMDDVRDVLYNIAADPEERINLLEIEPEVAGELKARLDDYIAILPDGFYPPEDPAGKPENFGGIWSAGWC